MRHFLDARGFLFSMPSKKQKRLATENTENDRKCTLGNASQSTISAGLLFYFRRIAICLPQFLPKKFLPGRMNFR